MVPSGVEGVVHCSALCRRVYVGHSSRRHRSPSGYVLCLRAVGAVAISSSGMGVLSLA